MRKIVNQLLSDLNITAVLVDVGASFRPPGIWATIAARSTYVGFDPDRRELHEELLGHFGRSVIVNEAVVAGEAPEMTFYLTRSPFCNSVLEPAPELLSNWLCQDEFEVERTVTVKATTIASALKRIDVGTLDWLKVDSQGTDLTLFNSLEPGLRARVLALDIEPGFVEAYRNQDLLVDADHDLSRNGFWLADASVGGFIRMRRTTLRAARAIDPRVDEAFLKRAVRPSPAFVNARYLRTIEWLSENSCEEREYVLLWVFAAVDHQFGFCLDLAFEFGRIFGESDLSRRLMQSTLLLLKRAYLRRQARRALVPLTRGVNRVIRRVVNRRLLVSLDIGQQNIAIVQGSEGAS
jgi:hypothetical protein